MRSTSQVSSAGSLRRSKHSSDQLTVLPVVEGHCCVADGNGFVADGLGEISQLIPDFGLFIDH